MQRKADILSEANKAAEYIIKQGADEHDRHRSKWPHLSYEQGVENALNWAAGNTDDKPLDD